MWRISRGSRRGMAAEADHAEIVDRVEAGQSLGRHLAAADAGELHRPGGTLAQRPHQRCAEPVAGFLGRDQENVQPAGRRLNGAAAAGGDAASVIDRARCRRRRSTKIPARSAAAASRSGSATSVEPATTAMPPRPAAATASTVGGPIAGRSMRRSWPSFGAFTSTPVPTGELDTAGAAELGDPQQGLVGVLRALHRQHLVVGHDHGLADVERADGVEQRQAPRDIGAVLRARLAAAEQAQRDQELRRDLGRADQAKAEPLEHAGRAPISRCSSPPR